MSIIISHSSEDVTARMYIKPPSIIIYISDSSEDVTAGDVYKTSLYNNNYYISQQ